MNDDLPWNVSRSPLSRDDGKVEFQAPANRTLQCELKDLCGRDMKKSYTFTEQPGTSAVNHTFVVTP
jgi:hypothetical protein